MLDMFLPVTPAPKDRPRFGSNGKVYNTQETLLAERAIKILVQNEMKKKGISLTEEPVFIKATFCYRRPLKLSDGEKLLYDVDMLYKVSRPDLDNLVKLLCDALNGVLYKDDNQVVKLLCEKKYNTMDGILLTIVKM